MALRVLASLHASAPALLRDHVHIARMLSASAAAASTAQADLLSSPLPTSSHVAASAAQSESATAIGSQDERFNASAAVQEMFRRHNTSLPDLQGQVVVGTVVQADKRSVLIDVGYKSLQRFFRSELANAPIYSQDGSSRGVPVELMVGDLLHFTIRDLDTIFGDMLLDVHSLRPAERAEQVLQELEKAQVTRTPVLGRILNPVTRGYSVGIGGIVAFLPMSQCLVRTAQRIGVLQPFVVSQVKRGSGFRGVLQPNVIVCDVEKEREVEAFRRRSYAVPSADPNAAMSAAERARRQRDRQQAAGYEPGRRAASAYAMLRKSRRSRQQPPGDDKTLPTVEPQQPS